MGDDGWAALPSERWRQEVVSMMYWDGHGGGGGGWIVSMAIMMFLFWGSLVALIWVAVRALLQRPQQPGSTGRPEARDILAERLARGDIDPEDFQRRLEALGGQR